MIAVGGPALTYYVTPTEEELFKKYSPDLQKKSLANRDQTQAEFNEFVGKLKEYSKSDKPSKYPIEGLNSNSETETGMEIAMPCGCFADTFCNNSLGRRGASG